MKIHESRAAGREILVVEGVLSAGNDVGLLIEPGRILTLPPKQEAIRLITIGARVCDPRQLGQP